MDYFKNVVEYFDEIYPCSQTQKTFFSTLLRHFTRPARVLRIACGTAALEFHLAGQGHDVIGIDTSKELITSAYRRRRHLFSNLRFFHMSTTEMSKYLVKNFFDIITCLNDRIVFMHDEKYIRKFFKDCRALLSPGGMLVLHLQNYGKMYTADYHEEQEIQRIKRERVSSYIKIKSDATGSTLTQEIKTASGKSTKIFKNIPINPLTAEQIRLYALEANFSDCCFYSAFDKSPYSSASSELICHIS